MTDRKATIIIYGNEVFVSATPEAFVSYCRTLLVSPTGEIVGKQQYTSGVSEKEIEMHFRTATGLELRAVLKEIVPPLHQAAVEASIASPFPVEVVRRSLRNGDGAELDTKVTTLYSDGIYRRYSRMKVENELPYRTDVTVGGGRFLSFFDGAQAFDPSEPGGYPSWPYPPNGDMHEKRFTYER